MPASGVTLGFTGTMSTVNGVISGTTVNGTTWATTSGSTIIGLADASYSTSYSTANVNLDVKTDGNMLSADAGSLRFNTNTGGTITLTLGGTNSLRAVQGGVLVTSNVGANNVIITGGILQGLGRRDSVFIQNNTQGYLQIDSILTDLNGSGAQGITKSGAGTMILTANNTIGGPAVINEGTLIVTGSGVAGVTKNGGTINAGTLNQVTFADVTGIFVGQKVTQTVTGGVLNNSGGTTWVVVAIDTVNNIVTLSNPASGPISNGNSFVFSGAGGLGATTTANSIAAGATLQLGNGGTTGSLFAGQGITDNGLLVFNRSNAYAYGVATGENITGTGSVTQAGTGPVTLGSANTTNTYTGATTVNNGATLIAGSNTAFGTNSATTIIGGGLLQLNGKTISLGSLAGGGTVENASATSVTLTLGGNNTNTDFGGTLRDGTGGGTLAIAKTGSGTQTFSGTNTSTGALSINSGAVNITGSFGAIINVANTANAPATLKIGPGAVLTSHVTTLTPSIAVGNASGAAAAVYQTGGSVTFDGQIVFGTGGGTASAMGSGFYSLSGGSIIDMGVGTNERFRIAGAVNNSTGVFYQSGGSVTLIAGGPSFEVSGNGGGPVTNSIGIAYHTGGTMTINTSSHIGFDSALTTGQLRGEQTIAGTAQVTINGTTTIGQSALDVGILNLDGGTYAVRQIAKGSQGQGYVNFNGGILKAAASATGGSFLTGLTAANIYSGGATIDTNNQSITIGQALLAPTGSGVTTIPVVNGGAGYVGAPVVSITGGGGTGATAVANMIDDGTGNGTFKIDSITITNAGTNYTSAPTISVIGGGGLGAIFGTVTTATNASGGLIKTGLGTLTLSNTGSTYSGETDVNQGTLLVTGSISGSTTKVNNTGTLGGTGTVGDLEVTSGGTLSPGTAGLGTLSSSGAVSLDSGSSFKLEINTTSGLSDVVNSSGAFNLALSNDVQLSISDLAPGSSTNSYVFVHYASNSWNGGLFTFGGNVIPDGGNITIGANTYTLDYNFNGNSVALLAAVPEPGSIVSLCGGFGVLLGLRRMRRRR
jgi:autotransporter-associated beta strand protein